MRRDLGQRFHVDAVVLLAEMGKDEIPLRLSKHLRVSRFYIFKLSTLFFCSFIFLCVAEHPDDDSDECQNNSHAQNNIQ